MSATFAELCNDSIKDHGAACPGCWHSAADAILAAKLKRDEVDPILRQMCELADKSSDRPNWADVLPFILGSIDQFYQHGSRGVPTFATLVDKMGHAANQAK